MAEQRIVGALIGWKRRGSDHGIVLSLQIATSFARAESKDFDHISLALNDRQLRSLARDLQRAAAQRNMRLFAKPAWHRYVCGLWKNWFRSR